MSGLSSNKLKRKNNRGPNRPLLINFYTNDQLFPSHDGILFSKRSHNVKYNCLESLNTQKGDSKSTKKQNKALCSTSANHNCNNSLSRQNYYYNKSNLSKTTKMINDNHTSQEKISTIKPDSISIEKINLSHIEKSYKDLLLEKDQTINHLKAEILLYKNILKTPDKKSNDKMSSSKEKNEEGKFNAKLFSERLNNFYTPKSKNLYKTICDNNNIHVTNPNNLFKQCSVISPTKTQHKPVNNTVLLNSFNTKTKQQNRNSFNRSEKNIELNHLRNSSTKATNVSLTKTKSIMAHTPTHTPMPTPGLNCNNNSVTILNQLKEKTETVLSKYYKLNQHLLSLNNVK